MSPRFGSPVIDQMLTRGQITRVAPNRAQSDQLLTQAEAPLALCADAARSDEAVEMATAIHQRARLVLDHMFPY